MRFVSLIYMGLIIFSLVGCDDKPVTETSINAINSPQSSTSIETMEETVEFTDAEKTKLYGLIEKIPAEVRASFSTKYEAWKVVWDEPEYSLGGDAKILTITKEYQDLLQFCREQGEVIWPMAIERLEEDDWYITKNLLEDLTFAKYRYLMDEIRETGNRESYTEDGKYIAPSEEANVRKYAKAILALF